MQTICISIGGRHPEVFLRKHVLGICSKFTGEHQCRSVISITLLCNAIEIKLRHWCSPVNLLHIFRTPFSKNTCGRLLLKHLSSWCEKLVTASALFLCYQTTFRWKNWFHIMMIVVVFWGTMKQPSWHTTTFTHFKRVSFFFAGCGKLLGHLLRRWMNFNC